MRTLLFSLFLLALMPASSPSFCSLLPDASPQKGCLYVFGGQPCGKADCPCGCDPCTCSKSVKRATPKPSSPVPTPAPAQVHYYQPAPVYVPQRNFAAPTFYQPVYSPSFAPPYAPACAPGTG